MRECSLTTSGLGIVFTTSSGLGIVFTSSSGLGIVFTRHLRLSVDRPVYDPIHPSGFLPGNAEQPLRAECFPPCSSVPVYRALQEAQEIFGGDFDFAEFDADGAYEQGEEEEEDQDEESWDRPKKQTKRRVGRKSIFEIYEPSELESSHMTDQDNEIRSTDMPERFQVCVGGCAISIKPCVCVSPSLWVLFCSCVPSQ